MAGDWIKLHRQMLTSAVMRHDGLCQLWIYCLLRANWQPRSVLLPGSTKQIHLQRGQFITGRRALHAKLYPERDEDGQKITRENAPPSPSTLWRWLQSLQSAGQVAIDSAPGYSVITICNYSTYQDDAPGIEPDANQTCAGSEPDMNQTCAQSKKERNTRREEGKNPEPPKAEVLVGGKPKRPPSGPHQEFIAIFCDKWEAKFGVAYPFSAAAGRNAKAAKAIRESLGDDQTRWKEVIYRFLSDDDVFYQGHDLGKFQMHLARWLMDKPNRGADHGRSKVDENRFSRLEYDPVRHGPAEDIPA